jgi:hypothetical protein
VQLSGRFGVLMTAAASWAHGHARENSFGQASGSRNRWKDSCMHITPLISLIAGVLILVMPRLLNYIVALYLIVVGLIGLFPHLAG